MRPCLATYSKLVGVLSACLLGSRAYAQQEVSRVVTVHPVVGSVIDQQEKLAFGLFPTYRLEDFREACFWRFASLDSTQGSILLQVTLRTGDVRTRSYSEREFQQVRNSIEWQYRATLEEQKQEGRAAARKQALPLDTAVGPRYWYVGTGATFHQYVSINRPYSRVEPVYILAGYTIKPKIALQAEARVGYYAETTSGGPSVINGETYDFRTKTETRSTAVTILARFTRSRIQQRFQFDWLAGFAIVHGRQNETIFRTSATHTDSYNYSVIKATQPHFVGGISLRYLFTPHIALGTQLLLNKNMTIPLFFGWGSPLAGADVGVSYLFGNKKFAPAVKE